MMTNFDTGWGKVLNSLPPLVYAQTLGFVPGEGKNVSSGIQSQRQGNPISGN